MLTHSEKTCQVTLYSDAIYFGGAEEYLISLARGLDRDRFGLQVILPSDPGAGRLQSSLAELGVPSSHLRPPGFSWKSRLREMVGAFQQTPGDVLHINLPSTYDAGVSSIAWAAKRAGYRRVVTTEHLPMIDRKYKKFPIKWGFTHSIDRILTPAQCNVDFLTRLHGMPRKKIEMIPNGVGAPVPKGPEEVSELKSAWGIEQGDCVVGVVGRLTARKGQTYLIEAAAPLILSGERLHLVFVGDGEDRVALEAQAEDLGISKRVTFAGLRADGPSMPSVFDVFALPSLVETMPLSILEAMACARPVLSTRVFGIPDMVEEGKVGMLVPPGEVEPLREALLLLVQDEALRSAMGRAAERRYQAEYTARMMAERTGRAYLGTSRKVQESA